MTRPRYGVDGFPYLLALSAAAAVLPLVGTALRRRPSPASRAAGFAATTAAVAAAVPAVAGLHYVTRGKFVLRDRLLDAVRWSGDEVVADLGAGAGLLGIGAAHRTSGPVHCVDLFIAKDLSGNTPERLRANARAEGVADRIVVHHEDVAAVSLAAASVDVVLSSLCLHNIADPAHRRRALEEVARIVRPGGTVALSDLAHVAEEYAPVLRAHGFTVDRLERVAGTFPPQRLLVAHAPR